MKKYLHSSKAIQLLILLCGLLFTTGRLWAGGGGTHYISATTADPAQGLVYMSTSNKASVANSEFKNYQPGGSLVSTKDNNTSESNACYTTDGGDGGCTPTNQFYWARPARGYEFKSWEKRGTN